MFNLVYNEILKQTKKLSFKICFIILLVFSVALPILFKVVSNNDVSIYTKDNLKYYESEIIRSPKSDDERLKNELNRGMISIIKLVLDDENLNVSNEFNTSLIDSYTYDFLTLKVLNYGFSKSINYAEIDSLFLIDSSSYVKLSDDEVLSLKSSFEDKCVNDLKSIKDRDYISYLKNEIETYKNSLEVGADTRVKLYEEYIRLGIKDSNDFRINEGSKILENINLKEKVLNESEFNKTYSNMKYDTYLKIVNAKNREIDNKIKKSWYSIRNNVNYSDSDVRGNFEDSIRNNAVFLGIIMIVISGGIVSSEFQKGTIRMLVIKPSKRWKILLSKFLALVFIGISLMIVTSFASFLVNGVMFGFRDYFKPVLSICSGDVKEICYFGLVLFKMMCLFIPIMFVSLIAFCLSTVTHNTALSVGISIFLELSYSLVIVLLLEFGFGFIDLTFFPYLDYSQFFDKVLLYDNNMFYGTYYNFTKANLVLLGWSLIIYFVSNLTFVKRDIKN